MSGDDQAHLDRHFENIRGTALADLRKLADNDGGMGVFLLGTPIIDALAKASAAGNYWEKFINAYMPRLGALAGVMNKEFQNPGAHALSASSRFRFTSGKNSRHAHATSITLEDGSDGFWLHADEFAKDVERAFHTLWQATKTDDDLRRRALRRFDKHPPVGPAPSPGPRPGEPYAETEAASGRGSSVL